MIYVHDKKIKNDAAWFGEDLDKNLVWIYELSAAEINILDAALANLRKKKLTAPFFEKKDFPVKGMEKTISQIQDELEDGLGFLLIRGLKAEQYTEEELVAVYYGLGLHMGRAVEQNPKGELLGVVKNVGDIDDKNTRVYETNAYLPYHTDLSDVVGLLSLQQAKEGGMSSLVSAAAIYNTILKEAPGYLKVLYEPFYFSHLGEDHPTASPIFSYHKEKLSCRYLRQYIELGHEKQGVPLSKEQREAMDLFDEIMHRNDIKLDMMLQPGDMQFANNYMVLHSRTGFQDYEDISLRRKLIRLWLKMPNARELAPTFPGRNGFSEA